jgi:serine/threonine protein kinase
MTVREFEDGAYLLRQGSHGDSLYVLTEGIADGFVDGSDGVRHSLAEFGPGDVIGEMALLTRHGRTASIVARGPVRALALDAADFEQLVARHPQLGLVLTHLVAERLGSHEVDGMSGKSLDQYRIVRTVGRGAMGVVYEAEDMESGKRVALKMMSHRLLYESGAAKRFEREASIVKELRHARIAAVYRQFAAYHTLFFAMEFCDGPELSSVLAKRGTLPVAEARAVMGQLADAICYLHENEVLHRDVKPGNIMFDRGGDLKLTDFGLAKAIAPTHSTSITEARTLLGTPIYMAPEQFAGDEFTPAADIYGLGCIAFEMLTGKCPFSSRNFIRLVQSKATFKLPPRDEFPPDIDDAMYDLMTKALAFEPEDRTVDLQEVASWAGPISAEYSTLES